MIAQGAEQASAGIKGAINFGKLWPSVKKSDDRTDFRNR